MKPSILNICLFIFYNAESQTWLVSNPTWVYRYEMYGNYGFETNEITGDTMLDGFNAKIITQKIKYDLFPDLEILSKKIVRENGDSAWVWVTYAHKFILEYNLTLTAGDTFFLDTEASNFYTFYTIDSLGFTDINGQSLWTQYVTLNWEDQSNYCNIKIIERIGMIDNMCFSHFFLDEPETIGLDGPGRKFCSYQDDDVSLSNNQDFCQGFANTINSTIDSKVIIYPNPASDFVYIEISEELYQYDLQILDINGSVIKTFKPESNKEIDISDLFSGIYIVRVFNKNNFLLKKFIKM